MGESSLTLTIHSITLAGILAILGLMLQQHKVWVRIKDRVNALWFKHCKETGEPYSSLENGRY